MSTLKSQPIQTVEEFIRALEHQEVREVSDNLFLNFPAGDFLYPDQFTLGWIGTNHNLYQLLVLNQRYPSNSQSTEEGFEVSAKAYAGLFRGIGFGAYAAPDSNMTFNVFDRKASLAKSLESGLQEIVPTTSTGDRRAYASNIQFPVFSGFEQTFAKDLFLFSGLEKGTVDTITTSLAPVWKNTQQDIFKNSWKMGSTEAMFLRYLGAKKSFQLEPNQAHNLAAITPDNTKSGIDLFKFNDSESFVMNILGGVTPEEFYRKDGQKTYEWWSKLARDYGSLIFSEGPQSKFYQDSPTAPDSQPFVELIQDLSAQYAAAPKTDYKTFGSIESVLQATLRFYLLFNYQATQLNTQNSLPYSDSANPFVPGSFEELRSQGFSSNVVKAAAVGLTWEDVYGSTFLDTFAGNEAWVDNLKVSSLVQKSISGSKGDTDPSKNIFNKLNPNNVYDSGWIKSADLTFKEIEKGSEVNPGNPNPNEFETVYYLDRDATRRERAIAFGPDTTTSDIFTASQLSNGLKNINRETRIGVGLQKGKQIKDLGGLVTSADVLPEKFKTYIELGGGIDRITGSRFADVIVGTTKQDNGDVTPGSLTVLARAGDDVVAPGRGSGIISLGSGRDQLVIDKGDTFGRTTLFDFKFKHDSLVLHQDLKASIDVNNDQFLFVFNEADADGLISEYKTLHLTQSSGAATSNGYVSSWSEYFNQFASPELQDALVAQPPGLV